MITKLKLFFRNTPIFSKTIYRFAFWFLNDILKYRRRLLQWFGPAALKKINDLSRHFDVALYPSYGTLLGIVREKRFLRHDDDMDFAVLPDAKNLKAFFEKLMMADFRFELMATINGAVTEVRFRYWGLTVDFFFHSFTANRKRLLMIQKDGTTRRYEYPIVKGFRDYKVYGVDIRIPENHTDYLCSLYGEWNRIVKKGWHSAKAPGYVGEDKPENYDVKTTWSLDAFLEWLSDGSFKRMVDKGC